MALKDNLEKLAKAASSGIEIADVMADIFSIRRAGDLKAKLTKVYGGDEPAAAKTAEAIEKVRTAIGGIGAGDEIIMNNLLRKVDLKRRIVFTAFMSWVEKKSFTEHNILYRHLVLLAENHESEALSAVEDVIDILIQTEDNAFTSNYCRTTYLAKDSTYQAYKKVKETVAKLAKKVPSKAKEGYDYLNAACEDGGRVDTQIQSAQTTADDLLARAKRFRTGR